MLAHTVLIITSGLAGRAAPDSLDRAIHAITAMKKNPFLILGADGDDLMRTCSQMDSCEMIFDPNESGEFSPVKAGLHATKEPAFIWQIDRPFPGAIVWQTLDTVVRRGQFNHADLLQFEGDQSGLFLATANGVRRLKERPAEAEWPVADDISIQVVSSSDLTAE